jgi:hypothetical protein
LEIGLCISFANAHGSLKGNLIKFKEFVSRKAAKKAQRRKGMFFFASLRETNSLNYTRLAN